MTFWQTIGRALIGAAQPRDAGRSTEQFTTKADAFVIQRQDQSGLWGPVGWANGTPVDAAMAIKSAAKMFPDSKIRCVDANGRLVDLVQPNPNTVGR